MIDFHSPVFFAPAVVGLFTDTQLTGSLANGLALGDENLCLPEMTDDLFCGITFSCHDDPFLITQFLTIELGTFQGVRSITRALDTAGIADDTLIIFTSDNGPWISYGNHAGSTPYREAKGTSFDGGTRSACVMRLPGEIPAGSVSKQAFCSVDFLPTFCRLASADLPDNPIDGVDVWDIITGDPGATNPHEYYPVSAGRNFDGVVSGDGKWELHLPHTYRTLSEAGNDGQPGKYDEAFIDLSLFDMVDDPYETTNVIDRHPDIAEQLQSYAEHHRQKWWVEKD